MSSTSSELGKRRYDNSDNISTPPLKKPKLAVSSRIYCFASFICVDTEFNNGCNHYSLYISNSKNIFSIGYSSFNAIGHDNKINIPKQLKELTNIKMISCGACHSICLSYEGEIFSFGRNNEGQLGIGKHELKQTHFPQKISIPPCKQVSCGNLFTICLTDDNKLYSFGDNYDGQLALGNNNEDYNSPQLIPDFNNIEYIVCGGDHVICKTYNNEIYSWGFNDYGQLGQGNNESCNKPIQCLNWPDNIIDIKCGYDHSLLLTSEGQVYSFGRNSVGQLGINDKNIGSAKIPTLIKDIPEMQRIECGSLHSLSIDINNNLWLFGNNSCGQLGLGDTEIRYKPTIHSTLSNIIDISSGGCHTFVKTIDKKIYAFGYNNYSQLGIETSEHYQLTPLQAFFDNEDIWCSFIGKSKQKSARK